jgi:transposase
VAPALRRLKTGVLGSTETGSLLSDSSLGGVSKEVLYDNMKTVIIERNAYGRGVHRFHAGFLDYARHAGFLPRLCQPRLIPASSSISRGDMTGSSSYAIYRRSCLSLLG